MKKIPYKEIYGHYRISYYPISKQHPTADGATIDEDE